MAPGSPAFEGPVTVFVLPSSGGRIGCRLQVHCEQMAITQFQRGGALMVVVVEVEVVVVVVVINNL
ncbi:hypothetical protein E2C01_009514 [Portunus trituberculatus]|uniref:Uncharacterized protein n=1 Tax=Portunus trituberculatus TaxID=210409 RepID=A0A5B7D607_PORTR|nr:hypothetical protein [Portunus trituberculatus]